MKDVNAILSQIKVRPLLYLGELSITRLHSLMQGYAWGVEDCTGTDTISSTTYQFTWHLTHKYRILESINWCGILLSLKNNNEEEALSLFWEEWDEFLSRPCTCPQEHFDTNCEIAWHYCGRSEESLFNDYTH